MVHRNNERLKKKDISVWPQYITVLYESNLESLGIVGKLYILCLMSSQMATVYK